MTLENDVFFILRNLIHFPYLNGNVLGSCRGVEQAVWNYLTFLVVLEVKIHCSIRGLHEKRYIQDIFSFLQPYLCDLLQVIAHAVSFLPILNCSTMNHIFIILIALFCLLELACNFIYTVFQNFRF